MDLPKDDHNRATCESCHGVKPHKEAKINHHANRVACQTCHIPEYARGGVATKMLWDWSTAGKKDADGKPLFIKDEHGHLTYSAAKGDFKLGENVRPEYKWYNGVVHQMAITDKFDDSKVLEFEPRRRLGQRSECPYLAVQGHAWQANLRQGQQDAGGEPRLGRRRYGLLEALRLRQVDQVRHGNRRPAL
jgi:hypothetical protein